MIYFELNFVNHVAEIIYEAEDYIEVAKDLSEIEYIYNNGSYYEAERLHAKMLHKYPIIMELFQLANALSQQPTFQNSTETAYAFPNKENLKLDYYGIICDVALKKRVSKTVSTTPSNHYFK